MGRAYRRWKRRRQEQRKLLPEVPSYFLVPPPLPPGFGIVGEQYFEETVLITGQIFFDDPFYNVISPPPFGPSDPAFPQWVVVMQRAEERYLACPEGRETQECALAREAYFEAARQYAYVLDREYGFNRLQPGQSPYDPKPATAQKNRT
ncbi:hypothetical protein EV586_103319 [Tumebacillus sp. BK434]|uniref:hypothetical protein n=1 Tax=Tumebacillus sp. BK434 TaxID=2512169 RepID=UPI001042C3ED|nr:hypothetical protein [Tumebacillus sp. BK434]TCP55665.1 hypothetical protein EV586_103319 [Tumebacillus sp. BK434]